jgi:hypothetical protein
MGLMKHKLQQEEEAKDRALRAKGHFCACCSVTLTVEEIGGYVFGGKEYCSHCGGAADRAD